MSPYHTCSNGGEDDQRAFFKTAGDAGADPGAGHSCGKFSELIEQSAPGSPGQIADLLDDRANDQSGKKAVSHSAKAFNKNPV